MHAVLACVRAKPGQDAVIRSMVTDQGAAFVRDIAGAKQATWFRVPGAGDEVLQHALWLFDGEVDAQQARMLFEGLREQPDAPSEFVSAEVCEVVGHEESGVVGQEESKGARMTRWQYGYCSTWGSNVGRAMKDLHKTAGEWGAEGWEMVNFTTHIGDEGASRSAVQVVAMFKRASA